MNAPDSFLRQVGDVSGIPDIKTVQRPRLKIGESDVEKIDQSGQVIGTISYEVVQALATRRIHGLDPSRRYEDPTGSNFVDKRLQSL